MVVPGLRVRLGRGGARRWRAAIALGATATLLSGCLWTQVGYGPEHRRENPADDGLNLDTVATVAEVWSAPLPGADHGGTETEPIVDDERVYVGRSISDADGGVWVSAFDAATGAPAWERRLLQANTNLVWPVPLSRVGGVLTAGYMGIVSTDPGCSAAYAGLDPDDGSGTVVAGGVLISPAVTSGNTAVRLHRQIDDPATNACGSNPAIVRARTVSPAGEIWANSMGPALSAGQSWPTSYLPTVSGGRTFVAWGQQLRAFALAGCGSATCNPVWTASLASGISSTIAPVVTNGGDVVVLTQAGQLVSYAAGNGQRLWRADTGWEASSSINPFGIDTRPSLAVAGDVAFLTSTIEVQGEPVSRVQAFAADGCGAAVCSPLWTTTVPGHIGTPAVTGGVLFVGITDAILAFDTAGCGAATCEPVTTIPYSGWVGTLSIADGRLYATGGGRITAFAPVAAPEG